MWPRFRLDVSWSTFFLTALPAGKNVRARSESWGGEAALATLSVRTAFDLYLGASTWPAKSEVLMSAVTIPAMAELVELHGHRVVPVPVDARSLAPRVDDVRERITEHTRAIVVAHLFGARSDLAELCKLAECHGLHLIEDAAQAFDGRWRGSPGATMTLFSFGPIKTATAFGGALAVVSDPRLRAEMRAREAELPTQSRWSYARRVAKFAALFALSHRVMYSTLPTLAKLRRTTLDGLLDGVARSFPGDDWITRIRQRPSRPLLALLARRIARFDAEAFARRGAAALEATDFANETSEPVRWVQPVRRSDPAQLVVRLRQAGFDAARHATLANLGASSSGLDTDALVYLPPLSTYPGKARERLHALLDTYNV